MAMMNDYSETRACLVRARTALKDAHLLAGRTNLPPTARPVAIRTQIDALEEMILQASSEIEAARLACAREGRGGLTLV